MYTRLQIGICASVIALGLALSDDTTAAARAQTTKKAAKAQANSANHAAHASIIAELHQAKRLLDIGLHDYSGHRAKADHEVAKAIHLLQHGKPHTGTHKAQFKTPIHKGTLTAAQQSQSDSSLRQAAKIVQAAHLQLMSMHKTSKHDHHQQAANQLTQANQQIQLAVSMVHHHHKKNVVAVK